jgi:hypothetical protein
MRNVLHFRLCETDLSEVREIPAAPVGMGGPWSIQRDNEAVDGLPNAEASQTMYWVNGQWLALCAEPSRPGDLALGHLCQRDGLRGGRASLSARCPGGGVADGLAHAFGGAGSPGGKRSLRKETCCLSQLAARKQKNP